MRRIQFGFRQETVKTQNSESCLQRNLCAGQEATVRTGHGTDWFQIGTGVYCHPAYLTYVQSTSSEMLSG